ncbi:MAG: hypothetical protein MZW92_65330 [Comamonadaceae bacterium]|nr:hypothetical protein [Comamonadaceae bacterium]
MTCTASSTQGHEPQDRRPWHRPARRPRLPECPDLPRRCTAYHEAASGRRD